MPLSIYKSSAGSGKTYTLVKEYLKIILHRLYAKLVPRRKMIRKAINDCFYSLIHETFKFNGASELLDILQHMIFEKLDKPLMDYLTEKREMTHENPIQISHRQIASELGTARDVISRLMKKLEVEGKIEQGVQSVKIL